jgi:hypothetical protein
MSLPTSEPLPDDINDLPPARQRHIRRMPHSATPAEHQILLDSLVQLTAPTPNFFLFAFLGALLTGSALYFNNLALLTAAITVLPFLQPVFGLGLVPAKLKFSAGLKSLLSLLLSLVLVFASGALAGWLQKTSSLDQISVHRFNSPYWLDLGIVGICTLLGALVLLRQGRLPRLIGVLLSYEIFIPLGVAGFGFILGDAQLWPGALLVSLLHLGLAVFLAVVAFLILGFPPKRASGWLISLLPLILIPVLLFGLWNFNLLDMFMVQESTPTSESSPLPSQTPSPKEILSGTPATGIITPSTTLTPSPSPTLMTTSTLTTTPTQTSTFTETPTPEPTTYWGIVDALNGAVIRETPDFEASVIAYANDGDQIEILREVEGENGSRWYQVKLVSGETGWLLSSLVEIPEPTPTP